MSTDQPRSKRTLTPLRSRGEPWVCYVANMQLDHFRKALEGLHRYAQTKPQWRLRILDLQQLLHDVSSLGNPAALVVGSVPADLVEKLAAIHPVVVNISNHDAGRRLPSVLSDDHAVGAMAATYYARRGYRHFAFVHGVRLRFSLEREAGFLAALPAGSGVECFAMDDAAAAIARLRALDQPVAIFADSDEIARLMIDALLHAGLRVPADMAVAGVNDDPIAQVLSPVDLSSVALGSHTMGFEAGRLVDYLLAGGTAPREPLLVPPRQFVARRSAEAVAVKDTRVAAVLRLLHGAPGKWKSVEHLLSAADVPRRTLEVAFRRELGVSPHAEWTQVRLDYAKAMLVSGGDTLETIAERCGFADAHSLCIVFRRVSGMTPGTFRKRHGKSARSDA
jgi:LacI family transcriptional regulator